MNGIIKEEFINSPHVVILGAGASKAAFPEGDAHGKKLPVMNDLFGIIPLDEVFKIFSLDIPDMNFEKYYSSISSNKYRVLRQNLEKKIYNYFSSLEIPEEPTIYDYLVLSLGKKDMIATFNWDPFLYDACQRNFGVKELPQVIYLHGNVRIGVDYDSMQYGLAGRINPNSGKKFEPTELLYPTSEKNYSSSRFLKYQWEALKHFLNKAYILTIFGYGAPNSDIDAVELIKNNWVGNYKRRFTQTEIIDIEKESILKGKWNRYFCSHHYSMMDDFFNSSISQNPNRTTKVLFELTMEIKNCGTHPLPKDISLCELQEYVKNNY